MIASRTCAWSLLATLAAIPAVAQPSVAEAIPDAVDRGQTAAAVIATHAQARRRLPNTVSDASVTIEVHGRDVRGTAALLAQRSQTLLAYLRGQDAERLRTERTDFEPELQEVRGQPDRIKGFTGRAVVSFRTTPERLPVLLAGSLDNGATGLLQSGFSPREEELDAARRELAAEATRTALGQARSIAQAAEQRVAGIQRIEVATPRAPGSDEPEAEFRMARAPRPVPPIASEAGGSDVAVTVFVTIRLAPPG